MGPNSLLARQNPWSLHHLQHLKVATGAPHCHKAMLFRNISHIFTFAFNRTTKRIGRDVKQLYSSQAQMHHYFIERQRWPVPREGAKSRQIQMQSSEETPKPCT